jgi:hypothetical protein
LQKVTNSFENTCKTVDKAKASVKGVSDTFGAAYKSSGLKGFVRSVGSVASSFGSAVKGAVSIGASYGDALAGVRSLMLGAVDAVDKIGDLSEKYQVHAHTLQVFGRLVEEDGGSMEDAATSIGKLKKAMNEAIHGGKEQAAAFAGVGISIADLKKMDAEQVMLRMADAFKGSDNDLAKQAVLLQLMGKNGLVMMGAMNRGADAIRASRQEMQNDGLLLSEEAIARTDKFDKSWRRLVATMNSIKAGVGLQFAEALQPVLDELQQHLVANREKIKEWFGELMKNLPAIIEVVKIFAQAFLLAGTLAAGAIMWVHKELGPTVTGVGALLLVGAKLVAPFARFAFAIGEVSVKVGVLVFKNFPALMTGLQAVGGVLRTLWGVMMANPIMLIIGAVVLLVVMIIANWDKIVEAVSGAWERIKAVFSVSFFHGLVQVWLEAFQLLFNGILGALKSIPVIGDLIGKDTRFNFADKYAEQTTAPNKLPAPADVARQETKVGGTLKIEVTGANAKVTELHKTGEAMDLDVINTGIAGMG